MAREKKSAQVNLRIAPTLKEAADRAAADDQRSLTSLVEKLLTLSSRPVVSRCKRLTFAGFETLRDFVGPAPFFDMESLFLALLPTLRRCNVVVTNAALCQRPIRTNSTLATTVGVQKSLQVMPFTRSRRACEFDG